MILFLKSIFIIWDSRGVVLRGQLNLHQ